MLLISKKLPRVCLRKESSALERYRRRKGGGEYLKGKGSIAPFRRAWEMGMKASGST
jgi:hypothetical protein